MGIIDFFKIPYQFLVFLFIYFMKQVYDKNITTHSPRHVENPLCHNKSHPEEKVAGRNEGKHKEQQSYNHLPALLLL